MGDSENLIHDEIEEKDRLIRKLETEVEQQVRFGSGVQIFDRLGHGCFLITQQI